MLTFMQDADLIQRLHLAENDFLTALLDGTHTLASYYQTWSALSRELSTALQNGNVGHETLSLAHLVATRISKIATCFLDIKRDEELSTAQLQSEFDAMFHQMANLNINTQPKSSRLDNIYGTSRSSVLFNTPTSKLEGSSPPFLTSAYQWLLHNLHNPYPTASIKTQIAAASSCHVSSVNSWFINARRRIGWTTLCRERFSNCRADMLDAAYRALVQEDPQRALASELRHSFIAIKVTTDCLYSSTLTKSTLAANLDAIVKDMTEEDGEPLTVEKRGKVDRANPIKAVQDSYPSPDPSTTSSPAPAVSDSFTDESEEREDIAPPIIAGSKRCWSSVEPVDGPSSAASRPIKRLRASATSRMCLPSPSSSTDGIDISPDDSSPEYSSEQPLPVQTMQVLPPRVRCPFDAGATGKPQRPSGSLASPRFHTVSNHLLHSHIENEYSIDDWFNTNFNALFDIPPPVDATAPDLSAPWEVELFKDYSIPGNAPKYPPAPVVETAIPAPTGFTDLDNLIQSICNDSFLPSSDVPPSLVAGDCYTAPVDSLPPGISQINLDWVSLLSSAETYQSTIYSRFSQHPTDCQPLPEIDLSMLQLPNSMPAVNSQSDLASKQSKLYQLHTMQEAVRRMEQELRFEGIVV